MNRKQRILDNLLEVEDLINQSDFTESYKLELHETIDTIRSKVSMIIDAEHIEIARKKVDESGEHPDYFNLGGLEEPTLI